MTTWTWNLVNVVVSLAGYYAASMVIDNKMYGRKTMQQVSCPVAPIRMRIFLTIN